MALRRSFVEACKIRFDESVSYGEDQVFAFAVYPRSSRTCLIHDKLYDYRIVRGDSMLNRMLADKPAMLSCHIELERKIMDDWASLGILDDHCAMQLTWICEFILLMLCASPMMLVLRYGRKHRAISFPNGQEIESQKKG